MEWKYKITGHMRADNENAAKKIIHDFELTLDNSKHFHVTVEPFLSKFK